MAMLILSDNYCRDTVDDKLIIKNLTPTEAESAADHLNSLEDGDGPYFYRVVDDDYTLHKWEP
jgi:hypothetical protein